MDEDYEDMIKRQEKERKRQQVIEEKIAVPPWIQERMDKEREELERKRKEELGEFTVETSLLTQLPQHCVQLLRSFGLEGSRTDNVAYLAEDLLVHTCGDAVHFWQVRTKEQTFLKPLSYGSEGLCSLGNLEVNGEFSGLVRSKADRGIGAVTVHPQRLLLAVCEKEENPDIIT